MLLRRVIAHFKEQNWTAIGLDLLIVVLGVFIGMQASNWNAARAFDRHERELLVELRAEMERAASDTQSLKAYFNGVSAAGERSLEFLQRNASCAEDCWPRVVDFFYASQWTNVAVSRATYEEMRRQGLPRSKAVFAAAEAFYAENDSIAFVLNERPAYRNLVRGLIPVEAQRELWLSCHAVEEGAEIIQRECPPALSNAQARAAVDAIRRNGDISPTLTQWTSLSAIARPTSTTRSPRRGASSPPSTKSLAPDDVSPPRASAYGVADAPTPDESLNPWRESQTKPSN